MRHFIFISVLALAACANVPQLDDRITDEAQQAPYPTLITLDGPTLGDLGSTKGDDVIDELDSRTTSLWDRIGALF